MRTNFTLIFSWLALPFLIFGLSACRIVDNHQARSQSAPQTVDVCAGKPGTYSEAPKLNQGQLGLKQKEAYQNFKISDETYQKIQKNLKSGEPVLLADAISATDAHLYSLKSLREQFGPCSTRIGVEKVGSDGKTITQWEDLSFLTHLDEMISETESQSRMIQKESDSSAGNEPLDLIEDRKILMTHWNELISNGYHLMKNSQGKLIWDRIYQVKIQKEKDLKSSDLIPVLKRFSFVSEAFIDRYPVGKWVGVNGKDGKRRLFQTPAEWQLIELAELAREELSSLE